MKRGLPEEAQTFRGREVAKERISCSIYLMWGRKD